MIDIISAVNLFLLQLLYVIFVGRVNPIKYARSGETDPGSRLTEKNKVKVQFWLVSFGFRRFSVNREPKGYNRRTVIVD